MFRIHWMTVHEHLTVLPKIKQVINKSRLFDHNTILTQILPMLKNMSGVRHIIFLKLVYMKSKADRRAI